MRFASWYVAGALVILGACSKPVDDQTVAPAPASADTLAENQHSESRAQALALVEHFECARCHEVSGAAEVATDKHCVRCHRQVQDGSYAAEPALLAKWSANIHSLQIAPSLAAMGRKLRRDWVRDQLLQPRDIRPALQANMPRLPLSASEAESISAYFVPQERDNRRFSEDSIGRGAELFARYRCGVCHAFGDKPALPGPGYTSPEVAATGLATTGLATTAPTRDALLLAPDLMHTRHRFQSGALVDWLMDPQSLQPDTLMPNFHLKENEAASLAAYIWLAPVREPSLPTLGDRLPVLDRVVAWDEVFTKVFKKVCWHCHSSKEFAMGDGGPGNTGGFGFAARGLDLSSYEAALSGSIGDDGRRHSVFAKDQEGVPLLIRSMLVREEEVRGHQGPMRGMPLGFPPMSREQIQLVESWLAQGRPR